MYAVVDGAASQDTPVGHMTGEPPARAGVDLALVLPTGALALALILFGVLAPDTLTRITSAALSFITGNFGWLFILAANGFVLLAVYLALSRYGQVRLGKDSDRPEFRTVSWIGMMFAAGIGIGLIFYGVAEPVSHFTSPPPGVAAPGTEEAARVALQYTFLHWGLHGWAIYGVAGLALAYFGYRHGGRNLMSAACHPVLGDRVDGPLGRVIDGLAIFATLFGIVPSLGLGALQINGAMTSLWGIESSNTVALILIVTMGALMVISAVSGVARGVQFLANAALVTSVAIALFLLVLGPTRHLANTLVESVGGYAFNLIPMSLRTGTFAQSEWVQGNTIFYWVWWIAWAPFVATFIARISKGRTIREFVLGVLLLPSGASFIWFVIFGGSALHLQLTRGVDIAGAVEASQASALFALLNEYPLAKPLTFAVMFLVALFFVSGMDAAAVVMGILSSRGSLHPPRWIVVFWGALTTAAASVLLLAGGLAALQQAMVIMAAPFVLVMTILCVGLLRRLRIEHPRAVPASAPAPSIPSSGPGSASPAGQPVLVPALSAADQRD